ncbi:hypothetical protein AV530_016289 [Patagioenas fasciata monilis]|uniref:Uncharacterized protein n=1 Tax=Patagioenas fasciata monilis TaxID=372326 RepID=A0A1V4JWX4_PATFA|nr:hypothetical protein AV530_016289 [Patagioenas fasciata monilis]
MRLLRFWTQCGRSAVLKRTENKMREICETARDRKEQRTYVKRRVHDKILIDSVPSETEIQQHEESKHAV